jgi:D-beta-D-heptose 7-phosphate kinase/D-beta-D-heptose 1-phosphate adenosyltransferase
MDTLLRHLSAWKPFRALVVGDFMLDQHLHGDAERLAGDAPVPILHVKEQSSTPGGAANVCLDLIALGGSVAGFGVTGEDEFGRVLRGALAKENVDSRSLVADSSRPTTVKQNLIGMAQGRHPQKMFRVDFESRAALPPQVEDALLGAFQQALHSCDVVCIEDYAKGVCSERVCQAIIKQSKLAGKPVMVDPAKLEDYSKYNGATVITPNRTEAEFASGMTTHAAASPEHNARVARHLLERHGFDAVVLTLDKHGALLLERNAEPVSIPTIAREVYDVTGAGDMFLAGLAAGRANRMSWEDSVRFANAAAGLEVEVFGVQPIPFERVHHSIVMQHSASRIGKLRSWEEAKLEAAAMKRSGKRVVFTNGCFDVLHAGHVTMLEKSKAEGDFLIVGLNDDASVKRLKGPTRPVNGQDDRARVLGSLGCVDAVVLFGSSEREKDQSEKFRDTPLELIETISPDVLVKGADYTRDKVVGADFVESRGGRVALIDLVPGRSTTETIAKMKATART